MNRHETHEDKPKGVFIPAEILESTTLNSNEKILFGFYHYYTLYGEKHCCFVLNEKIGQWLNMQERTIQRAKKHLIELGLIEVNGVIYVRTKGDKIDTHINIMGDIIDRGDKNDTLQGDKNDTPRVTKLTHRGDKNDTHIKEEKRNIKDIKEKVKRKVEVMEETTTNTSTENELGFSNTSTATAEDIKRDYYNHINLNVPEWMIEMDEERNGEQPTNPSTFNYSREDEEREYKQHFKRMSLTGTNNIYPQRESEKVITPVSPCCPPSPSQTAKTTPQGARNTASGTTTHTEDKSPAEGAKMTCTREERKAFTEKWHKIKNDMINGKYNPKVCEILFNRVISDIPQYFSGEWVETITKNWSNDYEGIKYQIRGYETYEMLKEIKTNNETERQPQYLNYHVDGLPD